MRDYSPALIHASSRADGPTIRRDADCAAPILLLYAEEYGEVEYCGLPVKPSYRASTASASRTWPPALLGCPRLTTRARVDADGERALAVLVPLDHGA